MGKGQILVIVILLFLVPTQSFDFFKLALQWPISVCGQYCKNLPNPMNLTIHGLWPQIYSSPWTPLSCPLQNGYTTIGDQSLIKRLKVSWPDVIWGRDERFWACEWNKHGGCSEQLYNQITYFNLSVNLKDQFDIFGQLQCAGITPGNYYNLRHIIGAIECYTKKQPELICNVPPGTQPNWNCLWGTQSCTPGIRSCILGKTNWNWNCFRGCSPQQQLLEVRLCFDKNGVVIDCPGRRKGSPPSIGVSFPI
ncbi:hypothetical protein HYC85_012828 [Camellia sinensis]|uniref:Uncharacterized protein n=1 Tax=Camellia sinensis TaxID=4442 RepID=A0A7J7HDW7_CAMSI|nr:hypothetical protein HYC85_012828 [Camellia sinensis]